LTVARYYSSTAVETTLAGSIGPSDTTLTVASATGFPVSFPFTLILDFGTGSEEVVDVTSSSGTSLTVTRGVDSTTPISHSVGATVVHGVSARDHREAQEHIAGTTGVHGLAPSSSPVGTTDTQTLTNKTLAAPSISDPSVTGGTWGSGTLDLPAIDDFTAAQHDHSDAAHGGVIPQSSVTGLVGELNAVNALASAAAPKSQLPFNVRNYGAVGDGTADDAPAIQNALDAANTAGGGWVHVPAGVYRLATLPLRIYRNTRLTLDPHATLKRAIADTMILNGDADQDFSAYDGHGNIIIEGGTFDMQGASVSSYNVCMSLGHAENITVRDCTIKDVPGFHAIEMNAIRSGRVINVRFLGVYQTGDRTFTEAIQLDLMKGSSYFGGFGPYDNTPCDDVLIHACYFGASGTANTAAWCRGVGSHSATITRWHNNVRITNNHFEGLSNIAIQAYAWQRVVIAGNTINSCGGGIKVRVNDTSDPNDTQDTGGTQTNASQDSRNHVIYGNVIRNTGTASEAINLTGESTGFVRRAVVNGNVIDTTSGNQSGIRLVFVQESAVADNIVLSAAGSGISTANITSCSISNNRVYTPGGNGITVDNTTSGNTVDARGNYVRLASQNGIHILGGSFIGLQGNFVDGASAGTANTFYCFRITSGADSIFINGNRARKSGQSPINGLSITSTCTFVRRYGNDWTNSGATANLDDNSVTPGTQATDYS
jgi:Pectate lyase superfamily protein